MTYQVLARKWRPHSFTQVVGQSHVLRALINALNQGRLHHAYLFTGTRGVGKTTLARILAKCLNCEEGVSAQPCGECGACREIDEGRFVDLIEVDAASRTKVEDTRELLDNVQYAPTRGRHKVYLIDEVHMLSGHSFNALLKTLEEPPPHVKFLLATTDPQKLPVTILSRCLQFNLKRIPPNEIVDHLRNIMRDEGVAAEDSALTLLARAAEGSIRDALSLLDQAIAYGNGAICEQEVNEMLGTVSREHLKALVDSLGRRDAQGIVAVTDRFLEQAVDFNDVLAQLIALLHGAALSQFLPEPTGEPSSEQSMMIGHLVDALSPEEIQLFYQIALIGRRDLELAPDPRIGFEMTLLRMLSFERATVSDRTGSAAPPRDTPSPKPVQELSAAPPNMGDKSTLPSTGVSATQTPGPTEGMGRSSLDWTALVADLQLRGVTYALACNCSFKHFASGEFCVVLGEEHAQLHTQNAERRLEQALRDHFPNQALRLRIEVGPHQGDTPTQVRDRELEERQRFAESAIQSDAAVQGMVEVFGASIVPGSIRPSERAEEPTVDGADK